MSIRLQEVPLFVDVDDATLKAVAALATTHRFTAGETVIAEHDTGYDIYVFGQGSVEVTLSGGHGGAGVGLSKELVIGHREYVLFGEINWLQRRERTASVTCLSDLVALRIDGDLLWELIDFNPRSGVAMLHNLALLLADRINDTELYLKQLP